MTTIRVPERLFVPVLVLAAALLALGAAARDSATIDEPGHLAAGLAVWHEHDYRMAPDHPPLGRVWAALPVFLASYSWPGPQGAGWSDGDFVAYSRALFALNDSERLLLPARAMMVVLLAATLVAVWWTARTLWGKGGGALALVVAALDPGLLAHGHFVTTDLPLALTALLSLVAADRLLDAVTPLRVVAAAAALAAALLSKMTGVLLLPALALMAAVALLRSATLTVRVPGRREALVETRPGRVAVLSSTTVLLALCCWAFVWAGYGFRYQAFAGEDAARATMYPRSVFGPPPASNMDEAWRLVLSDRSGTPRRDVAARAVGAARRYRLLPEAYLFGLAAVGRHSMERTYFLDGDIANGVRWSYFPLAVAWKTPVATLLLGALGLAAVLTRRARVGRPALAAGIVAFAAVTALTAAASGFYIGVRHLLPAYVVLFAAVGAAWAWGALPVGRALVGVLGAWLAVATAAAWPHFLGYFNELAGGSARGFRLLADSNVDWSQDLLRLRDYERAHPAEPVALQSNDSPWPRGLRAQPLLPRELGERLAPVGPGLYVISANELLGLVKPYQRAATWRDTPLAARYRVLWEGGRFESPTAGQEFDAMLRMRLVARLGARRADDRIGTSLFVYRLSAEDVDALTRP
jgi:hypothetical protein